MALADITLNDGAATPVAHVFTFTSNVNNRVIRSDMAAALETPLSMTHAHSETKKNGVAVKSHLVRFDMGILDADGVNTYSANARVMVDFPTLVYSDAAAKNLAAFIRNYLSESVMVAFCKGSVG